MHETTKEVLLFIENNIKKDIDVEKVLEEIEKSKSHIYSVFKGDIGLPISKYIKIRKVMLAYIDLVITDKKIIEIAMDYNFYSHAEFSREFKKVYFVSPKVMRNIMRMLNLRKVYLLDENFDHLEDLKGPINQNDLFAKCIDYINYYIKDISNASELAKKMKMKTQYLNYIFKNEMNISINQYINFRKVMFSTNYLALNNLNIDEIGKVYGFKSYKSYCDEFKKIFEFTPQVFRNIIYFLKNSGVDLI